MQILCVGVLSLGYRASRKNNFTQMSPAQIPELREALGVWISLLASVPLWRLGCTQSAVALGALVTSGISVGDRAKTVKRVLWWVLGTVAAVPITKWVESQLNLSFFSPAILGLWSWMQSVGSWFVRDVSLPFWVVTLVLVLMVLLMWPVVALVYARYEKVEPVDFASEKGAPLTDDQNLVFLVVGNAIQQGCQFGFDEVRKNSGLSRIATHNALDHLTGVGLVCAVRGSYGGQYADLTPLGRQYFLELESHAKG
ncbi:hypothetical protein H097_12943 [Pseudomonas sp. FH4]|uniref:hypothetical protein n=1 Tax=Pseudomonas fluorescens group TaxID=136843 RepID=UPI0003DD6418|nr:MULTISPECIES: hypothetical protein [Pseudomonas fluorescens group]ETK18212.1 hypothetical protein H097_12943 [Pseudomonas sp. FH4]MBF8007152.1 hypothetical protein [Pseudomonas brenneri]